MTARLGIVLLTIPWAAAGAQVSRSDPTTVRATADPARALPAPVATAALRGLVGLPLPQGSKVSVRSTPEPFGSAFTGYIHSFRREIRDGKQVLVQTTYSKPKSGFSYPMTRTEIERVYPGASKLVYTGPWTLGIIHWSGIEGYYVYLLRPLDQPVRVARSPTRSVSVQELGGGTAPPVSRWPAQPITAAALQDMTPTGKSCDVPSHQKSLGSPGELRQLSCLLLEDGRGVTLAGGIRLFRRSGNVEIWQGDELVESVAGLVVRDGTGRHWLLEGKGYF